jgi:hypothetical protein
VRRATLRLVGEAKLDPRDLDLVAVHQRRRLRAEQHAIHPHLGLRRGAADGQRVIAGTLDHRLHTQRGIRRKHHVGVGSCTDPIRVCRQRILYVLELENGHGGRFAV